MCAIFGFLNYDKKISHKILTKLLRELSIAAEVRGTDATGISYVRNGEMVTFNESKTCSQGQSLLSKRNNDSNRTYTIYNSGQ